MIMLWNEFCEENETVMTITFVKRYSYQNYINFTFIFPLFNIYYQTDREINCNNLNKIDGYNFNGQDYDTSQKQ